ncbi:MAG: hypothetical protein NVV59_01740 [Chitinophagaceae bacterium]|nr:hypothetical protein [Chitinophagaceae bacterium]
MEGTEAFLNEIQLMVLEEIEKAYGAQSPASSTVEGPGGTIENKPDTTGGN